jgi:hypothetical protein
MDIAILVVVVLQLAIGGLLLYARSYLAKKAENQATKEDIASITSLVKQVEAKFQIDLGRHVLRNELHSKIAELLYELEFIAGDLVEKHGLEKVNADDVSYEDKRTVLEATSKVNTVLAKLYLTMPDDTYRFILDAVPDGIGMLKDFRVGALVSLRRAQFPDSAYLDPKFTRGFTYGTNGVSDGPALSQ